jgi:hypothetical protein
MYIGELTVHTWDLSVAIGHTPAWDADVVRTALESIQAMVPAEGRMEAFDQIRAGMPPEARDFPPPYQEAFEPQAGAAAIDRLVAWCGRNPAWAPAV